MAKERRATWFKLFTHSRALMDAMPDEAVGEALKAAMCYFQEDVILPMSPLAAVLFAVLRESADESLEDYTRRVQGGKKGGRPPKQAQTGEPAMEEPATEEPSPNDENQTKPQVSTASLPKPLQTEAEEEVEVEVEEEAEAETEAEAREKERDTETDAETETSACAQKDRASAADPACAQAQRPSGPSLPEIRRYARTIGASQQDTLSFYNCWSSLGWQHAGEPVTDWKAAFRDWAGPGGTG